MAPRDEPMLIPKTSFFDHPALAIALREASMAYKTELSKDLYLLSDCLKAATCAFESSSKEPTQVSF